MDVGAHDVRTDPANGTAAAGTEPAPIPIRFRPLFEASWEYERFTRLMPFGPDGEGQAYGYTTSGGCRVAGEVLSGSLRLVQFPRWRSDGLYLPDAHGLVETDDGEQVMVRPAGFGIHDADGSGNLTVSHRLRMSTAAPRLRWLNDVVAFGVGAMVGDRARVRYFAAGPAPGAAPIPADAPNIELLGTATWEYPRYDAVRPEGDPEGVGLAESAGRVTGGPLAGGWRGWHYPSYHRSGRYEIDAHAEITRPDGIVLSRHAGLGTKPDEMAPGLLYHVTQYATFATEVPGLARLNRVLAAGVGVVRSPGIVTISYYGLSRSS